ncbi:MAG: prephenate dehydrogenase [Syntrophomonadaceae bacterium]|nr:prephenate dehydrogenase [Syntrophomonadaceae bacterium]
MSVNVLIIGVGLIGGSLGLALKESPLVARVIGVDEDHTIDQALAMGAIDGGGHLETAAATADVIFLCTPISTFGGIIDQVKTRIKPGAIISDVGSTKQEVMRVFSQLPDAVYKIGGHPMAGSEIRGVVGADRYLFENAAYILTPAPGTPDDILAFMNELLACTGARIKRLTAERHDELVAAISHIPHLTAAALVNMTRGDEEHLMMAAGGFRDTTRIASSNPELWDNIIFSNQEIIVDKLDLLIENLIKLREAIKAGDREKVLQELSSAKDTRDRIPQVHRGIMPDFSDIVCIVPDKPGIIARLGAILHEKDINIVDIEILRVREGDGGTIRLGVPSLTDAAEAVAELQANGIKAWIRS